MGLSNRKGETSGSNVIFGDKRNINIFLCDYGIVSQSMLLGAFEKGLGRCIFASIKKDKFKQFLNDEDHFYLDNIEYY